MLILMFDFLLGGFEIWGYQRHNNADLKISLYVRAYT